MFALLRCMCCFSMIQERHAGILGWIPGWIPSGANSIDPSCTRFDFVFPKSCQLSVENALVGRFSWRFLLIKSQLVWKKYYIFTNLDTFLSAVQLLCHCHDCQSYQSAPITGVIVFPDVALKVVKGSEHVVKYNISPKNDRYFCGKCGARVYNTIGAIHLSGTFPSVVYTLWSHSFNIRTNSYIPFLFCLFSSLQFPSSQHSILTMRRKWSRYQMPSPSIK